MRSRKTRIIFKATPRNREEEKITGYHDAINIINENLDIIILTPNYILRTILSANKGFEDRFALVETKLSSYEMAIKNLQKLKKMPFL